ncbi:MULTISPECIES: hypothetical protein [Streptacidiphilus]|uniref:Uncharacterized protein n=1 Tax=Streptacidiphilus cavernicola TaxID=3342716 RepID=A0ABV6UXD1_9ACTN|nr:hypothetical protein [Streptacidiphilus jeojiense]
MAGIGLLVLAHWVSGHLYGSWVLNLPIGDVGSALFTTGLIAILFEYINQADAEERANERLRKVLKEEAPAIRDAVVDGFAFAPEALTNVSSPETLDRIITNCLTIQLGDPELAADSYTDLREQVVRSPERFYDARVSADLAPWEGDPSTGDSMFVATIRWEYRVTPTSSTMRFACVSDLDEYRELRQDLSVTDAWYFEPLASLDGTAPEAFSLVQCSVDGVVRTARRTAKKGSQLYSVSLGDGVVASGKEVIISYTYRTLVQRHGHLLHLDLARPTKGFAAELRYGGCGIRHVNVLDYVAGSKQPRISGLLASDPTPSVEVSFPGWVFPKGGVAFVWVLEDELTTATAAVE